jgi:hypothetical protein
MRHINITLENKTTSLIYIIDTHHVWLARNVSRLSNLSSAVCTDRQWFYISSVLVQVNYESLASTIASRRLRSYVNSVHQSSISVTQYYDDVMETT